MDQTQIKNLPAEMMMRIFRLLSPQDLKMVVLVSKLWRKMGEHPSLWTWCSVRVANRSDLGKLGIRRLQQIESIHVRMRHWQTSDLEKLFQTLVKIPRLRNIYGLSFTNLSFVETGLMARVVSRLEVVEMRNTKITNEQAKNMFDKITEESPLQILDIAGNNLSQVQPAVLATGV